jgi:hypothetical protein
MIILKPITTIQQIKIIPTRSGTINKISLRNESTNEVINYNVTATNLSFYTYINKIFTLKEGHFYEATFSNDDVLIHRDKIFCTNQTISTYSVNKDEYIASNDNIIFYE